MLKHPTLDQLHTLGLHGMAKAFADLADAGQAKDLAHEEAPARSRPDAASRDGDGQMRLARAGRGSDMAPGFWRVRRRSPMRSIRSQVRRWPRRVGASCAEASSTSRFA